MSIAPANNKRIAKNTALLYVRMFLIMGVSLFTSREVLRILGVEDFGIYNIVAGIIVLFSFLNNAMVTATQRFLNFELGKDKLDNAANVFSMSVNAHIGIALLILVGGETIGLWIFHTYINIPSEKITAAEWVYQLSILTAILNILRAPYNACFIAYENMSACAYISIVEVILKLAIVYVLFWCSTDRLVIYAVLIACVAAVITFSYYVLCTKRYRISRFRLYWDKDIFRQLTSFSGWSLFGSIANLGAFQGVAIIQNVFCGVLVNAAMGIANQVNTAIYSFSSNFQLAFNPQIIKSYAAGENDYFTSLLYRTSRYSYFLMFVISVPILVYCNEILNIWLSDVPEYAVSFCRLIICCSIIDGVAAPLWMGVQATGKIKKYQIIVGIILLLNVPLSYVVLYFGMRPEATLMVKVILNMILFGYRLWYLKSIYTFSLRLYIRNVILPCAYITIVIVPVGLCGYWAGKNVGLGTILSSILLFAFSALAIYAIGLNKEERQTLKLFIGTKILKAKCQNKSGLRS